MVLFFIPVPIIIPVVVGRNAESNLFLAAAAADTLQAMVEHASYIRCIKFLLSLAREDKRTGVKDSATLYAAYAALHTLSQPFHSPFKTPFTMSAQALHLNRPTCLMRFFRFGFALALQADCRKGPIEGA